MLEEIGYEYKVTKIDLSKDEQFKPDFKKISPFSKIPVIIDHENKEKFINEIINTWLEIPINHNEFFKKSISMLNEDMELKNKRF